MPIATRSSSMKKEESLGTSLEAIENHQKALNLPTLKLRTKRSRSISSSEQVQMDHDGSGSMARENSDGMNDQYRGMVSDKKQIEKSHTHGANAEVQVLGRGQSLFFERHSNVYIYIPNLIGYFRVIFALLAFSIARKDPFRFVALYLASFICDELDGRFARQFNQMSTFGAVLDMVTDRVATSCLLALLCSLYPSWQPILMFLLGLDIFSHWFQMYATLAMGATSHKDIHSRSWIVRLYYQHRLFMGFCCICVEVLYLLLYLLAQPQFSTWGLLAIPEYIGSFLPGHCEDVSVLVLFAIVTIPGFAIKQFINVQQLRAAAEQLVQYDLIDHKSSRR